MGRELAGEVLGDGEQCQGENARYIPVCSALLCNHRENVKTNAVSGRDAQWFDVN